MELSLMKNTYYNNSTTLWLCGDVVYFSEFHSELIKFNPFGIFRLLIFGMLILFLPCIYTIYYLTKDEQKLIEEK